MNKKHRWYLDGGGVSFDADYQAVLDRATTLGYTQPSAAQQTKQNQLVLDLKSAGVWSLMDVWYVFATDGDRNFAKINWKSPSNYLATESNTPTFTPDIGFTGNGSNMELDTGLSPSAGPNILQDDAGIYGYFTGTLSNVLCGIFVGNYLCMRPGTGRMYMNTTVPTSGLSTAYTGGGFFHAKRTGAAAVQFFKNGSSAVTGVEASVGLSASTLRILGGATLFSSCASGCFGAGASLNGLESAFYNAWNTYITSL